MLKNITDKKSYMKLILVSLILLIVIIVAILILSKMNNKTNLLQVNLGNGDAKIMDNYIITNNDHMLIIDYNGKVVSEIPDVQANWFDCINVDDNYVVIYGNFNKEIGICRLNSHFNLIENKIVLNSEYLMIDPSIISTNKGYYIVLTEIEGNVNNSDINERNGLYTVKLYFSSDMNTIEYVSDVIKDNHNIEDIELDYWDNNLYLLYEREQVDRGLSSIRIIKSIDMGKSWIDDIVLIEENGDNEPGKLMKNSDGYVLYYSSDKKQLGASYNGASIYKAYFDNNFTHIKTYDPNINDNIGNLLYDVKIDEKNEYYLYSKNYLSDNILSLDKALNKDTNQ